MRVDVSGRLFSFPAMCVCCGQQPDTQLRISASKSRGKRVVHTTTHYWDVPCCGQCIQHQRTWAQADSVFHGVLVVGFVLLVVLTFATCVGGLVAFGIALAAAFALRERGRGQARLQCSSACATPFPAARFRGWDGSFHSFEFDSGGYSGEFMAANSGKLVNVTPHGRQLLEWAFDRKRAELEGKHAQFLEQHQAEVLQLSQSHEDDEYVRWVARVEKARGPASRRAEKEAALRALTRGDLRERLMVEASRIEVQAALDKADALKSPASKLRTLRAAIEAVKADAIPEQLLSSQLESLEAAIAEIERQA